MLDKLIGLNNCIRISTHEYFLLAVIVFIQHVVAIKPKQNWFLIGFSLYEFKKLRRVGFNVTDDRQETQLALE